MLKNKGNLIPNHSWIMTFSVHGRRNRCHRVLCCTFGMKGKQSRRIMVNKVYSEDDLIPVSALADFTFCERRAALHFIERVWEDNICTAEGTILHERVDDESSSEVRGSVRIARSVWLRSLSL